MAVVIVMNFQKAQWWVNDVNITANRMAWRQKYRDFRKKYEKARMLRAQKHIYFWIIPRINRPGSESAQRLAEKSWQDTLKEIQE